jgi:NAD(P)-dependent dehydrogenase (short-subunit alcohol dehydrogenase family)
LIIVAPAQRLGDAFLLDSLKLLQHAAGALKSAAANGGAVLATIARMDGAFGLNGLDAQADPIAGGLAGLVKTAGHEWPGVHCTAFDLAASVPDVDEAALAVAEELLHTGPVEIGIAGNERITLQTIAAPLEGGDELIPFGEGDVVIVTGGARGVTAEVAVALAATYKPTLVLLGRSPAPTVEPQWLEGAADEAAIKSAIIANANGQATPKLVAERLRGVVANREIAQNIARMKAAGATVHYHSIDARNADAVRSIVRALRADLGAIRGFIHGAGVLADRRIEDKTEEQFALVYGTKIAGLRAALEELPVDELRALVLFSSSTGRYGRAGQVDYAIANEVLNKTAEREARMRPECRVLSINWGPWDGGMVTPALKRLFEGEGIGVIPLEAGADYLVQELSAAKSPVEIVVLGEPPKSHVTSPAAAGNSNLKLVLERQIDVNLAPVLAAHVLNGHAVLPMALMVEWLAHAAAYGNPGLAFHGFDNLRVLSGIKLEAGESRLVRLYAGKAVRQDAQFVAPVELRSVGAGKEWLHARAEIVLAAKLPTAKPILPPASGQPLDEDKTTLYDRYLFHGPALQGIERITAMGESGIAASVSPAPAPSAWIAQPLRSSWFADPLVLDSSFQLVIVWGWEHHGAAALPCFAGRYRQYRRSFPRERLTVNIHITKDTSQRMLAAMEFLDQRGELIARLDECECTIDPGLREAFHRNQLVVNC